MQAKGGERILGRSDSRRLPGMFILVSFCSGLFFGRNCIDCHTRSGRLSGFGIFPMDFVWFVCYDNGSGSNTDGKKMHPAVTASVFIFTIASQLRGRNICGIGLSAVFSEET